MSPLASKPSHAMKVEGAADPHSLTNGSRLPVSTGGSDLLRFYSGDHSDGSEENTLTDPESPRRASRGRAKSSGACVHCKSLKVRCEFSQDARICQRCQVGNYDCIPRSRKKRKPAPTHEDLQLRSHNQELEIHALLLKLDNLKTRSRIRERMSRAQHNGSNFAALNPPVNISEAGVKHSIYQERFESIALGDSPSELAVMSSFSPTQTMPRLTPPDLVRYCSLTPEEIHELFEIFFQRINPFFSILDEEFHTPQSLIWTSPFLFTVICSTAARYYNSRPELYELAQDYARDAAANALIDTPRSIDVCQAYLLMALYPSPKRKWEEDRRWMFLGLAIRIAIELGLDKTFSSGQDDRENLNKTRTWLNCFCADSSHAIQFGKMSMISLEDPQAKQCRDWYRSSKMNSPFDVHLVGYVQIILIMAQWRTQMDGDLRQRIRVGFDVIKSAIMTEEMLDAEMNYWATMYDEQYTMNPLQICLYRGNTTRLITAYLRLVVLAAGFQHAARTTLLGRDSEILTRSIAAAKAVINVTVERLYPTGNLRYAMEANFVYVSFAAAYLVNLLRPKFLPLIREDIQRDIVAMVTQLVKILNSDKVALDGRHTPALYSRFLANLMAKHKVASLVPEGELSPIDPAMFGASPVEPAYSWPDVRYSDSPPGENTSAPNSHDMDMDFSLTHFVRTVGDVPLPPPNFMAPVTPTFSSQQWHEPASIWQVNPTYQTTYITQQHSHWNPSYNDMWRT